MNRNISTIPPTPGQKSNPRLVPLASSGYVLGGSEFVSITECATSERMEMEKTPTTTLRTWIAIVDLRGIICSICIVVFRNCAACLELYPQILDLLRNLYMVMDVT